MKKIMIASALLMVVLVFSLAGCKQDRNQAGAVQSKTVSEVRDAIPNQTKCPVMGGAINKDLYTDYDGQRVYFCCAGCSEQFKQEPAKYMQKLHDMHAEGEQSPVMEMDQHADHGHN